MFGSQLYSACWPNADFTSALVVLQQATFRIPACIEELCGRGKVMSEERKNSAFQLIQQFIQYKLIMTSCKDLRVLRDRYGIEFGEGKLSAQVSRFRVELTVAGDVKNPQWQILALSWIPELSDYHRNFLKVLGDCRFLIEQLQPKLVDSSLDVLQLIEKELGILFVDFSLF